MSERNLLRIIALSTNRPCRGHFYNRVLTMTQSQEKLVSLDMICTDTGIASREQENPTIIQRFAQIMRDGADYPSVMCFFDGEYYKLIYGLNLLAAAKVAKQKSILVDVHIETSSPQRKRADKPRMVKKMLSLLDSMNLNQEEKQKWSRREVARLCGVDEATVRRKAKEVGYQFPDKVERRAKNGRSNLLPTSRLGQHSKLKSKGFDWNAIDYKQFEELVYEIVDTYNPIYIDWRNGSGGKGRDIEAKFKIKGGLDEEREELYFIEAKHFIKQSVGWTDVSDAFTWAEKYKPSVLIIATSNYLTNPCKDEISDWKKKHLHIHVIRWERKQIEELILSEPSVKNLAVKFKLIAKSMQGELH